jgi:ABC-type multidrug transport system fused ATPase/permease subunit
MSRHSRRATIRLDDVSHTYAGRTTPAVAGARLELSPGETVALVGSSGSGKSTIVALLLRLLDPTAGRILVDDTDLAALDADDWRSGIAWLPQEPTLFRGTVTENIRLGAAAATGDRIREAAELAGAHRFVQSLPDGYETWVGDGGRPLSAGERRRIGLARAFLRDAPLLVLDEPTANLDQASRDRVAEAIRRVRPGRTILLVTHDDALAAGADRVLQIAAGRIGT